MKLSGKTAVITGAGRGIGRAVALKLSAEGASVVVNDIDEVSAENVSRRIEEQGGVAIAVQADVSSKADVVRLFTEAIEQFGRLDILVNNAGIRRDTDFHNLLEKDWDLVIDTALKGSFNCAQVAQRYMVKQGYGKILNIGSPVTAAIISRKQVNYAAANAGLEGFTRALAKELGPFNINVNCIEPDFIDTEMLRHVARREGMYLDDLKKYIVAEIPLRRLGTADEVAGLAFYLVTDEASYISGQIIAIKGGP